MEDSASALELAMAPFSKVLQAAQMVASKVAVAPRAVSESKLLAAMLGASASAKELAAAARAVWEPRAASEPESKVVAAPRAASEPESAEAAESAESGANLTSKLSSASPGLHHQF